MSSVGQDTKGAGGGAGQQTGSASGSSSPPPLSTDALLRTLLTRMEEVKSLVGGGGGGGGGGWQKSLDTTSAGLHHKMDKLVRQLDDVAQRQKDMNKRLSQLEKLAGGRKKRPATHSDDGEDSDEEAKAAASVPVLRRSAAEQDSRWGHHLLLVGDEHWQALKEVDDLASKVHQMETSLHFRLLSKAEETIDRLYDAHRQKLLFAVPPNMHKVALSVGTRDLRDPRLITLQEASLEEVRRKNAPELRRKARILVQMVDYLLSQQKMVLLLLPPHGRSRIEVYRHWEDIVLEETSEQIKSHQFRLINLPEIMRKTRADFRSKEDYFDMWLSSSNTSDKSTANQARQSSDSNRLSPYGARTLFDLLQRTIQPRQLDEALTCPNAATSQCTRCLRIHRGGEAFCKSRDMGCRRCGQVGHFEEVHDVTDSELQKEICKTLGDDLYKVSATNSNVNGCNGDRNRKRPVFALASDSTVERRNDGRGNHATSKKIKLPSVSSGRAETTGPRSEMDDWYAN